MIRLPHEQNRREIFRRIQVGLAGLAGVLLLVGLTEFVVDNVRKEAALKLPDLTSAAGEGAGNDEAPAQNSEPLADLGVTPAAEADAEQAPAVPDLEPDPNLQKRMDRDPRQPPQ